jgi:heme exporter protein A
MVEVKNLSCRRNGRFIFRTIGFTLAAGGFLQVAGDNGSGKSSLLRILAGLLPPASGIMSEIKSCYIGHLDAVKPALTVCEMLYYFAVLQGATLDVTRAASAFGLIPLLDRPVRTLSAGQKRRLSLTRLMINNAPLWLLDEPTTALDTAGRDLLFAVIAQHRAKGGMVIAATHETWPLVNTQHLKMGMMS